MDGNSIIHCFDPPHILKVIRNNLYTKNLIHFVSEVWDYYSTKVNLVENNIKSSHDKSNASWDDVRALYKNKKVSASRLLRKITKELIDPTTLKMKVYVAAQVFSNTFGNVMLYCSELGQLPRHFSGTGHILVFFNNVFDSLNGQKSIRCAARLPPKTKKRFLASGSTRSQ